MGLERLAEKFLEVSKAAGAFALNTAASFEQWKISFDTMLGSSEKSSKLLNQISDFAIKTPFELPQLVEGSKRLLAYNIEAEKVVPTMQMLGNIASGVGMEKLPNLILAFGQVRAATRLTGMELRQFSEAGVPLLDALATKYKTTAANIQEMVSKGKISFNDVDEALTKMTSSGGKFFNLMENQSKTFNGVMSNVRDNFSRLALEIMGFDMAEGSATFGQVKEGTIFDRLRKAAQAFLDWMNTNKEQIIAGFNSIGDVIVSVINVIGTLINWVQNLVKWYNALGDNGEILKSFLIALALVLTGVVVPAIIATVVAAGPLIAAITAVTGVVYILRTAWETNFMGIQQITEGVINAIITAINAAVKAINVLIEGVNRLTGVNLGKIGEIGKVQITQNASYASGPAPIASYMPGKAVTVNNYNTIKNGADVSSMMKENAWQLKLK